MGKFTNPSLNVQGGHKNHRTEKTRKPSIYCQIEVFLFLNFFSVKTAVYIRTVISLLVIGRFFFETLMMDSACEGLSNEPLM